MSKNHDKNVSVFVDESGSFDSNPNSSRFYIVCMVFHDQSNELDTEIAKLNHVLTAMNLPEDHAVHAGPLIRMEDPYRNLRRQDRRILFAAMMAFIRRVRISYKCFHVVKRFVDSDLVFHDVLLQQIIRYLAQPSSDLNDYDRIKIYYDNGQYGMTNVLRDAFAMYSSKCEFVENVTPSKYKLFQVADMICTLELLRLKLEETGRISINEKNFFLNIHALRKNYLKPLTRKEAK